jgi:hypothetical protein
LPLVRPLLLALICLAPVFAQTSTLRGRVTDESGAMVPGATVTLAGPVAKTATTGNDGAYSFTGLLPGSYTAQASAPNLVLPQPAKIALKPGVQTLNLQLKIASTTQQVTVEENAGPSVTTDAANNAGALVLRGDDLLALSDDPDDLQADLQALAGPAAGPNGGAIYIDGFSGGQLPSKESIREIRINQNPFSPEYDKLGYGRIEIFTKPGTDKFHGVAQFNIGTDWWNSRNPYAQQKAPFLLKEYEGNVSGPIGKRASFFLDARKESVDNGAVINGSILDPVSLGILNPYTNVFRVPQRRANASPRFDYQIDSKNTLTVRYSFNRVDIADAGVGGFNLVSRAYDDLNTFHTVQVAETAVLSASVINEIRFQFYHAQNDLKANSLSPAIQVLGAFNGGGAQVGRSNNTQNSYEFQNYTSIARGAHSWRFGVRLREQQIGTISPRNFGGTFTFGGGVAPKLDANNQPMLDSHGAPVLEPIDSIERYRRTLLFQQLGYAPALIRTLGGGATQFSLTTGNPALSASQFDAGIFAGDDWRVRPNLTLSLGLRYETQTNIHDFRDIAPRIGIAWAPGAGVKNSRPKLVIRAGFGTFYDRFSLADTMTALRYNGILQQQFVIANPDFFPVIPPASALAGSQSTQVIQEISRKLRAPYILQSAIAVERQLPKNTTVAVTYANSHGLHLLRSRDITAPLNPVFLIESAGLYNQNQLIVNVNSKLNQNVSLFGSYMLNRAMSNTDGINTSPANPYNFKGEYGPAATDVHNRMIFGGSVNTKWSVRLSPLIVLESGPPFDITAGRDIFNTSLFNGRPGIAVDPKKPGLIPTRYGLLDPDPTTDEIILPRNFGRGPGAIMVNLRLSKTIGFGPAREGSVSGGGGPRGPGSPFGGGGGFAAMSTSRRYNLIVAMSIRNAINHTNPGPIIGNITSPLFGQANQPAGNPAGGGGMSESANNRRLELQLRFTF